MKSNIKAPKISIESRLKSILRSSPFTSFEALESIPSKPSLTNQEVHPITTNPANDNSSPTQTNLPSETAENNTNKTVDPHPDFQATFADDQNALEDTTGEEKIITHEVTSSDMNIGTFTPKDTSGLRCSKVLLDLFKLEGMGSPETKVHPFCPNVKVSCCNDSDEQRSMEFWNGSQRPLIEVRYESVINSLKYLMGWGQELYRVAEGLMGGLVPHMEGILEANPSQNVGQWIWKL